MSEQCGHGQIEVRVLALLLSGALSALGPFAHDTDLSPQCLVSAGRPVGQLASRPATHTLAGRENRRDRSTTKLTSFACFSFPSLARPSWRRSSRRPIWPRDASCGLLHQLLRTRNWAVGGQSPGARRIYRRVGTVDVLLP